jgi:hypothetical protein
MEVIKTDYVPQTSRFSPTLVVPESYVGKELEIWVFPSTAQISTSQKEDATVDKFCGAWIPDEGESAEEMVDKWRAARTTNHIPEMFDD